jgi:hypothetical protein
VLTRTSLLGLYLDLFLLFYLLLFAESFKLLLDVFAVFAILGCFF